jgi:hypothetical protein
MRNSISTTKKRLMPLVAASALLAGGTGAALLFAGGTADAAACAGATTAGTACTIAGSLDLTAGSLTLTAPPALGWGHAITGLDQSLSDETTADQTYQVVDGTGTGPAWSVQVAATQFTSAGTGTPTLADTGTFSTNGSTIGTGGLATDASAPTAVCATGSTCTAPVSSTTYPVLVTTGPAVTPIDIFNAAALSSAGTINIGSATGNLVGWWLNVPADTVQGTYTSTVSLQIITAP